MCRRTVDAINRSSSDGLMQPSGLIQPSEQLLVLDLLLTGSRPVHDTNWTGFHRRILLPTSRNILMFIALS